MLQSNSLIRAAPEEEVIACELAGEAALLSLRTQTYYGLDRVGAAVWSLIRHETSVAQVHRALLQRYDVEPERCERDLLALLEEMAAARLVQVRQSPSADIAA